MQRARGRHTVIDSPFEHLAHETRGLFFVFSAFFGGLGWLSNPTLVPYSARIWSVTFAIASCRTTTVVDGPLPLRTGHSLVRAGGQQRVDPRHSKRLPARPFG